ncbi:pyridoxal phosphate-dependent transferase [Lactifluus volemus]|nr:pyridoxal phosphate-dependent transferase [Lactifluus volemus]
MSALNQKLFAALASRQDREIRRRLPSPSLSISSSSTHHNAASTVPADFSSNDYLSLATSRLLRERVLAALHAAPSILGSGGSRLLVYNHAHATLETRLAQTFNTPAALLFNSGFDANAGFFACVPQLGDAVLYDAAIHASVHDGIRAHVSSRPYADHSLTMIHSSVFVAVESVYSMDGTVSPLREMLDIMDEVFPAGNAHMFVDEAHATGIYGPGGRGIVALLGLEDRVTARLHTFGKALAASGGACALGMRLGLCFIDEGGTAVLLTSTLIRDYLLNYARPLIYTTSLSNTAIIAASCSFDILEDGTAKKLAARVLEHSTYLQERLRTSLAASSIPPHILSLPGHLRQPSMIQPPTPIIPLLTCGAHALSAYLLAQGLNARPITWPTVPKGTDRVRVCLHAGNTRAELDALVDSAISWAAEAAQEERASQKGERLGVAEGTRGLGRNGGERLQSKL